MTKQCKNQSQLGGCHLHNLHCGYPACMAGSAMQPTKVAATRNDFIVIRGMHFTHEEIFKWHAHHVAKLDQCDEDKAIDAFAQAMKNKMALKREQGESGWNDKDLCTDEFLAQLLVKQLSKGDPVDIANFAMMLFTRNATNLTITTAMLDAYVMYHQVIDEATRKAKRAMGLVELPRILVDIYIDMQNNASRYTVDRRITTEERLRKLIEIPDEVIDRVVSNEF